MRKVEPRRILSASEIIERIKKGCYCVDTRVIAKEEIIRRLRGT